MKLQLKRSNVIESNAAKIPTSSQLEYGELAINYNQADPAIFLKDSNNNVIRISGIGNIADDGQVELPASTTPPANPLSGNLWFNSDEGRLYIYYTDADTSQWVDASPDSWDPTVLPDTTNPAHQAGTLDDRYVNSNGDTLTGALLLDNASTVATPDLAFDGDLNTGIFSPGADSLAITTAGTQRVTVDSSGNVGIGTDNPQALLHLRKDFAHQIILTRTGSAPSEVSFANAGNLATISNNVNGIAFETGTTPTSRMKIDSNGNVGIGTSAPAGLFHIEKDIATAYDSTSDNGQSSDTATCLIANQNGTTNSFSQIVFDTAGSNQSIARIAAIRTGTSSNDMAFVVEGGNTKREAMRITSSGNVGIGTTAPIAQLTARAINSNGEGGTMCIQNTGTGVGTNVALYLTPNNGGGNDLQRSASIKSRQDISGNYANLEFYTSNSATPTEQMRITSNGNVGIGTSSPSSLFTTQTSQVTAYSATASDGQVGSSATLLVRNIANTNDAFAQLVFSQRSTNALCRIAAVGGSSPQLAFTTNNAERLRIDENGNVGIGTTAPTALLTLAGGNFHNKRPSDFWTDNDYISVANLGSLSTQGSFEVDLTSNGYRNSGNTWTTLFNNNQLGAAKISLNPTGLIRFCTDATKSNGSSLTVSERMRITQGGSFLIHQASTTIPGAGNTTIGAAFEKSSSGSALFVSRSNNTAGYFNRNSNGSLVRFYRSGLEVGSISVSTSQASLVGFSDYRLKENVTDLSNGIDRLKLLTPRRFNFIAEPDQTIDGFIAHEISDAIPEAVFGEKDAMEDQEVEVTPAVLDEDGNVTTEAVMETKSVISPQGIDQSKLVPLLTAALQEAIAKIETLEQRLSDAGIA